MAMSKDEFKNAFREVISAEFSHIPCDEDSIDYTFSERFNKKMNKLIKAQRKPYYFLINTAAKKVAVIFVIFATLTTASMSVKAIREPVVNFIVEVYESFTRYFFDGDTAKELKKEYVITELPTGFLQTSNDKTDISQTVIFEDMNDNMIIFTQSITENEIFDIDNQKETPKTEKVNGIDIHIYTYEKDKFVFWSDSGYFFQITAYGDIDDETLIKMIKSIK